MGDLLLLSEAGMGIDSGVKSSRESGVRKKRMTLPRDPGQTAEKIGFSLYETYDE